jgi:hypothetical protein
VTDKAALAYADQLASRKQAAVAPEKLSIPRLDARDFSPGQTMAQQAAAAAAGAAFGPPPGLGPMAPPPEQAILPMDLLPNEARQDPNFRDGQGSMVAQSQPWLAKKYGVIRGGANGQFIPPQQIAGPVTGGKGVKKPLRPQTVEGLERLAELNQAPPPDPGEAAEADAKRRAGGVAARLANAPGDPSTQPVTKEERARAERTADKMDDFDFDSFRQTMIRDIVNNEEQRKIVEERCEPLNLDDLIMGDFVEQVVPIIPDRFFPTFKSITGEEDLAIKRLLMEESRKLRVEEHYFLDKYAIMTVVVGTTKINNNPIPSHMNDKGEFDDAAFWKKFNFMIKKSIAMLASLGINYFWFDVRVRKLFVAEKLSFG